MFQVVRAAGAMSQCELDGPALGEIIDLLTSASKDQVPNVRFNAVLALGEVARHAPASLVSQKVFQDLA